MSNTAQKTDFEYSYKSRVLAFDLIEKITINEDEFNEWRVRVLSGDSRILTAKLYVSPNATQEEVIDAFWQEEDYEDDYEGYENYEY